jgi:hypothetical protein
MQRGDKLPEKVYVSEASPWTIAQQKVVLSTVIDWTAVAVFQDQLGRHDRRHKNAASLIDRGEMLRPTSRKEPDRIHVASLSVLAWEERDFASVVETVIARGGVIISVDDELTIAVGTPVSEAVASWKTARKRSRTIGVKQKGARVSADKKKAIAAAGVERIKPYWGMSADEWPTPLLRQMAGSPGKPMAYNTIVEHLGIGRSIARKRCV